MLLVQTNNIKEQSTLQEEFSREGNLFIIPIKKTGQINVILDGILFQIFGQSVDSQKGVCKQNSKQSQIVQKICKFMNNMIKLKFSLSLLRQIFDLIKMEQNKIKFYEEYIIQMNRQFNMDQNEDEDIFHSEYHQDGFMDLQNKFQEEFWKNNHSKVRLDEDIGFMQVGIESLPNEVEIKKQKSFSSALSLNFCSDSPKDQQASTMHTLKSQLTTSPKFSLSPLAQFKISRLNFQNQNIQQSFNYSQKQSEYSSTPLVSVRNQINGSHKTGGYFYCPQWKKQEDNQKKNIKNLLPGNQKKSSNESNLIDNLSGRVHPVPSFLHDESIGELIMKQKKQDLRKSNILKKSMKGVNQNKNAVIQHAYSSALRQIKFQNKRRTSKNLLQKKDLKEIQQQYGVQKQVQDEGSGNKINQNHSQSKIQKQKPQFKEKQQKNIIRGRTESIPSLKTGKQFNFFKSQKN